MCVKINSIKINPNKRVLFVDGGDWIIEVQKEEVDLGLTNVTNSV